ncbi:Nitric oxide oxidoreductase (Eurofung) [Phytophthora palmivora]|uniref:Nitric oxide oxidoreductase (Eurofung) n=1 Tax=Phytophthora palmivora TaxID=4796 RepID=A0A2P4YJ21_9STRA|nr:Nitric oxide oxidoreductase (Eurofung) [Phytophthora palmivora]
MGTCASRNGPSAPEVDSKAKAPKKFAYSDVRLMKKFLPSFIYYEKSTEEHRRIAAQHWDKVFKDAPPQRSSSVVASTPTHQKEAKHITKAQNNKITELYDVFYAYLEEHGGDLKHVFRSSMHVRGRVLVHISAGMRTMLASENIADKILALTKTHRRFGVKLEHFDCVGRALLHAMERTSGENWSSEIDDAWRRIYSHSSVILIRTQTKTDKQANKDTKRAAKEKEKFAMVGVGPSSNLVVTKTGRINFYKFMSSIGSKREGTSKSSAKVTGTGSERENGPRKP